jgi:hypothetical protein
MYAPYGRVPLAVFDDGIFVGFIGLKRISSNVIPVIPWELIETVRVEEAYSKRGKYTIIVAEVRRFRKKKNKKLNIILIPGTRDAVKIMMKHIPDKVDKEVLECVKDLPWLNDGKKRSR